MISVSVYLHGRGELKPQRSAEVARQGKRQHYHVLTDDSISTEAFLPYCTNQSKIPLLHKPIKDPVHISMHNSGPENFLPRKMRA